MEPQVADHATAVLPGSRKTGELFGIQYLRGIAAILVVIFHLQPQLERMGYGGPWVPGLTGGVDIFFVISGFIMWVTTCSKPMSGVTFWKRRIIRIVPLYWTFTLIMVVMMLAAPAVMQTSRFSLPHVVSSFLFVPWLHPAKPAMEPVVMPGWTLNYEMFFYLLFGLSMFLPRRLRFAGTVGAIIALVALGAVSPFKPLTIPWFYTSTIMVEFALGMGLGWLSARTRLFNTLPAPLGLVCVIIGLLAVVAIPGLSSAPRLYTSGIAAAGLVGGMLILEGHGHVPYLPLLRRLGDASYSIYLSQLLTMSFVSQVWRRVVHAQTPLAWTAFSVVCVLATAAVGYAVFLLIETPLLALFKPARASEPHVTPVTPASAEPQAATRTLMRP